MVSQIYQDILQVSKQIKSDINVFFYNDLVNNFYVNQEYTDKNGQVQKGWVFQGFQQPSYAGGAVFGFFLSDMVINTDTSGMYKSNVLSIQFRYSEMLDYNLFNPQQIHDRGVLYIKQLLNELKKCGKYIPGDIVFNFVDLEHAEQVASVYCQVQFTYIKNRKL